MESHFSKALNLAVLNFLVYGTKHHTRCSIYNSAPHLDLNATHTHYYKSNRIGRTIDSTFIIKEHGDGANIAFPRSEATSITIRKCKNSNQRHHKSSNNCVRPDHFTGNGPPILFHFGPLFTISWAQNMGRF